jgi:hypothetical protein
VVQGALFIKDTNSVGTCHHMAHGRLVALDRDNGRGCLLILIPQVMDAGKPPIVLFCTLVEKIVCEASEVA